MSGKRYGRRDFQGDMREQRAKDEKTASTDEHLRQLTFALLRRLGRVRVSAEDIAALDPRDKVSFAGEPNGDVIVTYECAASEEPGAKPKLSVGSH